ncbi:hypothetical protein NX059_001760 [Plenodomus lindquistii]|nr:hypothetical protein NX059_001760 [Plenodomus lindquistii]
MVRFGDEEVVPASQNDDMDVDPRKNLENLKLKLLGAPVVPSTDLTDVGQLDFRASRTGLLKRNSDTPRPDLDEGKEERPAKRRKTAAETIAEVLPKPSDGGRVTRSMTKRLDAPPEDKKDPGLAGGLSKTQDEFEPAQSMDEGISASNGASNDQLTAPTTPAQGISDTAVKTPGRAISTIPTPTRPSTFILPQPDSTDVDPVAERNALLLSQREDPMMGEEEVMTGSTSDTAASSESMNDVSANPVFEYPSALEEEEEEDDG